MPPRDIRNADGKRLAGLLDFAEEGEAEEVGAHPGAGSEGPKREAEAPGTPASSACDEDGGGAEEATGNGDG